jgi:hypothetical protein
VSTPGRLAAFAVVLAGSFGAGAALGTRVGPLDVGGTDQHEAPEVGDPGGEGHTGEADH